MRNKKYDVHVNKIGKKRKQFRSNRFIYFRFKQKLIEEKKYEKSIKRTKYQQTDADRSIQYRKVNIGHR